MKLLGFFLTWWGAYLIAALDASMVFFLPFGVDAVVIFLSARDRSLFWVYPLLATAGSATGAAVTYWLGRKVGEVGLERYVPRGRRERLLSRVRDRGAIALALPALMPPPFPLTPFILTCGALRVRPRRFFVTFVVVRLLRFGIESVLALVAGAGILRVLRSDRFQAVIIGFIAVAVVGTIVSGVVLWRSSRRPATA